MIIEVTRNNFSRCVNLRQLHDSLKLIVVLLIIPFVTLLNDCLADNEESVNQRTPTITSGSPSCYGLGTTFRFIADRYDDGSSGPRRYYEYNFAHAFDFGLPSKIQFPAYAKAVFESASSTLQILFFSDEKKLVFQSNFKNSKILECGPDRTVVSYSFSFGGAGEGHGNRRIAVLFSNIGQAARVETSVEGESGWLLFSWANPKRKKWAEFMRYVQ